MLVHSLTIRTRVSGRRRESWSTISDPVLASPTVAQAPVAEAGGAGLGIEVTQDSTLPSSASSGRSDGVGSGPGSDAAAARCTKKRPGGSKPPELEALPSKAMARKATAGEKGDPEKWLRKKNIHARGAIQTKAPESKVAQSPRFTPRPQPNSV